MSELVKLGQQHSINFTGREIDLDGIWGPDTQKNAIMCVQIGLNAAPTYSGLEVDGIWGPATYAALNSIDVNLCKGYCNLLVTSLEICLMLRNIDPIGVENPGEFGARLWSAVTCFQSDNGLAVDGIAGVNTFCALLFVDHDPSGGGSGSEDWRKYDPNDLPNFKIDEFDCKCGCGLKTHDELKCIIQCIRDDFSAWAGSDVPFLVTDGARCQDRNAQEGGTSDSLHLDGWAVDIQTKYEGRWYTPDEWQKKIREFAGKYGCTTGNYYGSGGGWVHIQKGRVNYDECPE